MKILVIANTIRSYDLHDSKNITGLKKILGDIYYNPKLTAEKYFWISSFVKGNFKNNELRILRNSKLRLLSTINLKLIKRIVSSLGNNRGRLKELKNDFLDELQYNFITKYVDNLKPNIVHIHDITRLHNKVIRYLIQKEIKCFLTLHIYIGKSSMLREYNDLMLNQKDLFSTPNINRLTITCVSSKQAKRLLNDYGHLNPENIHTILNGTDFKVSNRNYSFDIRNKFKIDKNRKILLSIGTVCDRKNQLQILQSLSIMNKNDLDKIFVLFVGDAQPSELKKVTDFCHSNNLTNSVKYIGALSTDKIKSYYAQSDFIISTSKNEAFGLTFIEGFVFGLPSITFSDLDAIEDLYNPNAMEITDDRSNEGLKNVILSAINKKWDAAFIKQYSLKFGAEQMIKNYNELYQ
ncbi:glycosyltransferase family 4 protein [Carboxylicivirga mesophila]|uniref:Glycosyltransferase family 4 protein n=1 Tax=Carboxylicivirga mesophila TaxID=1166478 RepID=A0ABS5K5G3_9BACT|nr:glycosyltransferase family 4 protein [Carboxylicivirga mesophila]MBS2210208.1 glycosyltransferase family 4 protein [Carboxylicivirga mesophila]